jgi:ADYC domain-containing protein/HYR domain-containing protein/PA14 domain-containing protein
MLKNSTKLLWLGVLALLAPGSADAGMTAQGMTAQGMTAQGMTAQGMTAQGMTAQGMTAQGMTAQGMTAQGMTAQGMTAQGMTAQGMTAQGMTAQGMTAQGMTAQGVVLMGTDLIGPELNGVAIKTVDIRGTNTTSGTMPHVLTSIPGVSTGIGNYISVAGPGTGSVVGHYAVAHMAGANGALVVPPEDLDLYIAEEKKDPMSNLFHRAEEQDNQDELYMVYFFHKWSGQWMSLCPYDANTKMASAMAIPTEGPLHSFFFACTATGVASKCARNWGYRPWASTTAWVWNGTTWALSTFPLREYYDICIDAAMAGYCQDGRSYTKNGTLVDMFDTRQIIWPNAIENPFSASNRDSQWMMAQEYFISTGPDTNNPLLQDSALQRTRYKELSPAAECQDFAFVDRLEHDHIEDGRWAAPLTNTPRLQVVSPTHCTHSEYETGPALPWDCTPCTTQVCKTRPECCGAGPSPSWGLDCRNDALALCKTGSDQWPAGRVWPANIDTDGPKVPPKFLFGPQGAVMRVEGTSGSGSSVTVSGWACDPEWPNATVAVAIYEAPADTIEGALAVVQADQAIATPLAREVSAACDGPGRSYARHGFSYTLPANLSGKVFVYARDTLTADGPPAPPTLIRNGIIQIPRCAHSEHVAGTALEDGCSDCVTSVCDTDASCCSSAWTEDCADLANACAPGDSSAPGNSRQFAAVTTGWIEAPSDGTYTFDSSLQPSRLFINGTIVLDWFETSPGTTQGSITLRAGQKYHLRWDRFQAEPPPGGSGPGLTWRPPGAIGQVPIPSGNLYAIAPGSGSGLKASYFDDPGLTGTRKDRFAPTPDPFIDINTDVKPPTLPAPPDIPPPPFGLPYSAIWEGEVVPSFSEDYTFYVVGSGTATLTINGVSPTPILPAGNSAPPGCGHDLCEYGDKLDLGCNWCVDKICAANVDSYCCNGGYLSYYSFEPVWDAKCISEVNQHCGAGMCSTPPIGAPGPAQKKFGPVPMVAGVRYAISLTYDSTATDKTIRLQWSSARQSKEVIPQFALFPKDVPAGGLGAGLNVAYFGTTTVNNVVKPDLSTGAVVAVGFATDFSLTPTIGQTGTPIVELLASPADTAAATPPPPMLVRPRYEDQVSDTTPRIKIEGIGGLPGGSVRIGLDGDPTVEVIAPVGSNGTFGATVDVGSFSAATSPPTPRILKLLQRAPGATCVVPTTGACSYEINWPVMVVEAADATKAPVILSPTDPTHSPAAVDTTFTVVGQGTSGPVHIVDQGSFPDSFATPIIPAADGSFTGQITLTTGDATTPLKGWHKLVFDQGGLQSHPVFVSVGIDPPTVEFPRSGAELDCDDPNAPPPVPAVVTLPYAEDKLGPLHVFEETGREALGDVGTKTRPLPPSQQGLPRVEAFYNLSPGRHVLLFFQAPVLPQGTPQPVVDEHLRAFSSVADTPTSRIVVNIAPPRIPIPQGIAGILGGRPPGTTTNLPPFIPGQGPLPINVTDCPANPLCVLPLADVNVRVGERLFTVRASDTGAWSMNIPLTRGWNRVTFAQVSDSKVGGAWKESCLSNELDVGVTQLGGPRITVPADIAVDAAGPQGATVFYPDVTAVSATTGALVPVDCQPVSGSTFRVGRNAVLCTATDPDTGALGLGEFAITVRDLPPEIFVSDVVAEADQPTGTVLNTYPVVASDVVDRDLLLVCIPPAPNFFLIDEITPVMCEVTDSSNQKASAQFTVRVVDTTPPEPCPLSDIMIGTNSGAGAIVDYATCANDIVDGPVPLVCDHPSGSFFPFGTTVVKCVATDAHGNRSAPETFTVSVGDTTPPVLKLPTVVTAIATSKLGARVSYTVTATDNVDPNPRVKCNPPSGAQFPLGKTVVTCKATDASGNSSQGTFIVKVIVKWSGLLPPIPADGSGEFNQGSTIPVKFSLVDESAPICGLLARLYIAPLDAAGNPGPEKPAKSHGAGSGNVFQETGSTYHLNMDTKTMAVGRWRLRVDLGDGEPHPTNIKLR